LNSKSAVSRGTRYGCKGSTHKITNSQTHKIPNKINNSLLKVLCNVLVRSSNYEGVVGQKIQKFENERSVVAEEVSVFYGL
jgi:hypothetical protein